MEDQLELRAALERMEGVEPVRSRQTMRHRGNYYIEPIAFSPDGRFFATADLEEVRIWWTSDWSLACVIEQQRGIADLAFSPDDGLLYVAGVFTDMPACARYDTGTGKLGRRYEGHKAGIYWMRLASDGKTMITASHVEDVIHVWDTETGKIARSIELVPEYWEPKLDFAGGLLVRQTGARTLAIETIAGESIGPLALGEGELNRMTFSPDGRHLITSQRRNWRETLLTAYDAGSDFKVVSTAVLRIDRAQSLAVSPDGKRLLVGDKEGTIWVLSLPELRHIKKTKFAHRSLGGNMVERIAFSRDGKLLAATQWGCPAPHLLRADTFEEYLPYDGHGGRVERVYFPEGGRTLRTFGSDNTICLWDAATMEMSKRFHLPEGQRVMGVRPPDGRYAVCYVAELVESGRRPKTSPAIVFDTESGTVTCRTILPADGPFTRIHWLNGREAVVATWKKLCRFNYLTGKILSEIDIDNSDLGNGRGEVTEDRESIFIAASGYCRAARARPSTVDIETGDVAWLGEARLPRHTGNQGGLVPGGKYFYIGNPGLYIFDRKTLALVCENEYPSNAFSPDGSRYASAYEIPADRHESYDPKVQGVVHVHDTLTGKMLYAFLTSRWRMKFSPDGKRLAVINGDDTVELWHLPELTPSR